jgi:putative ABC transport system permease protein
MSREFARLVLAANLIAWPAAWYFMGSWLKGFAYRDALSPWSFVVSGAIAMAIALATVVSLSARAAVGSPSKALRYE